MIRVLAVLAVVAAACGPRAPEPNTGPTGGLAIRGEPADAMLYIDDRYVGTIASLKGKPLPLPEGLHRIEVRMDGYFAHFAEVTVASGVQQRLEVTLRKEPF